MTNDIKHNRVLDKMRAGHFVLGLQLRSRSALIAELAGYIGFDYLYIETEHFACSDESIENIVRAAQISGITPWIRVNDCSAPNIEHLLDIGVQGIIIPHLETAEGAQRLVDAVKFSPQGHRGNSVTSRAACFGFIDAQEYIDQSNRNCSAIGMIESVKGVENLELILDAGIDIIRVGRGDLSLDMGLTGKQEEPRFVEMLRHITSVARKKGIPVGTTATTPQSAAYYKDLGFTFLSVDSDLNYLKRTLPPLLESIRKTVGTGQEGESL